MLRKIFAIAAGKTEQQVLNDRLHLAAVGGQLQRVQRLVQQGAEVDCVDADGRTPLYFAAGNFHLEVARFLLEHGANPDVAREDTLGPPLVRAASNGDLRMVNLLLDYKADINNINYCQRTALHEACYTGQKEAGFLLLERGADPNTVDRMTRTPLHEVIGYECRDLAVKLAEHGANGDIEFKYGDDIRKKAEQRNWDDVVQALDGYKVKAAHEAAVEKAALDENLAVAPVLQNDIAVKKPLIIKPKSP